MGELQLSNKVILITGALGTAGSRAVALFLQRGAKVAACDLKPVAGFDDLLGRFGEDALLYQQADCCDEQAVQQLIGCIRQHFGRLDGVYHNVYTNHAEAIAAQSLQNWEECLRGTLTSAFLVIKYAAALMGENGGGSIVSTSSVLGTIPRPHNAGYGAGKAGLEQLTRIAAYEYASRNIRVNAVVPGDFKSEQWLANMPESHRKNMQEITLLGRSGAPNEINEVAAFLLSDAASYVTGSLYPVTGGILH
ncbi:SDR family NAD(P)-dependent oxidoreductase [Paenibacillus sp. GCM10027626]|uniref:SDR family NAD(P)-dependent oxidoreductase n=1 Tax=Paenibacillus sp. GCM10027626 TaxID=3273411 RepID=UPI00363783D5